MRRSSGALDGVIKLHRLSVDLPATPQHRWRRSELTAREWLLLECFGAAHRPGGVKERVQQARCRSGP